MKKICLLQISLPTNIFSDSDVGAHKVLNFETATFKISDAKLQKDDSLLICVENRIYYYFNIVSSDNSRIQVNKVYEIAAKINLKNPGEPFRILSINEYNEILSEIVASCLPLSSFNKNHEYDKKPALLSNGNKSVSNAENIIYFGPPGTGKSNIVKSKTESFVSFRTQFHPEYTHADLIGVYRTVVGYEKGYANQCVGYDSVIIDKPFNYFAFVPGPLAIALACAFRSSEHVFLIIEEINRGDCSAIFGEFFQLLDRNVEGRSDYGIAIKPELLSYFKAERVNYDIVADGRLYLPPNLSLVATMNTSDQSLYPMDSAFKRRWHWISCLIDFKQLLAFSGGVRPFLNDGKQKWDWIKLLECVNKNIVRDRMEDKQIGPWFIKPAKDGSVSWEVFLNKCLFYLWHDVFKDEQFSDHSPFIVDGDAVFGAVQEHIRDKGLAAGFKPELLTPINAELELVTAGRAETPIPTQTVI